MRVLLCLLLLAAPAAAFELTLDDSLTAQRRDGSGLLDIVFTVEGIPAGESLHVYILPTTSAGETLNCVTLSGDTPWLHGPGQKRVVWDIGTDVPGRAFGAGELRIRVTAGDGEFMPGMCRTYCVKYLIDGYTPIQSFQSISRVGKVLSGASGIGFILQTNEEGHLNWVSKISVPAYEIEQLLVCSAGVHGLFTLGSITDRIGRWTVFARLTTAGDWDWAYTTDDRALRFSAIAPTPEGGFVIAGSNDGLTRPLLIAKFDSLGRARIVNEVAISHIGGESSLVPTRDGGYALLTTFYDSTWSVRWLLAKFDPTLNLVWTERIEYPCSYFLTLIQTADDGFAFVGTASSNRMAFVKTDTMGAVEVCETFSAGRPTYGTGLIQTDDLGYLLTGYYEYPISYRDSNRVPVIVKLNEDGDFIWSKQMDSFNQYSRGVMSSEEDFILAGDYRISDSTGIVALAKFRFDGTNCCARNVTLGLEVSWPTVTPLTPALHNVEFPLFPFDPIVEDVELTVQEWCR